MNHDLISVIIPVYRVESYLEKCVNSILDQTYQNLEIILVDDGSDDKCPQICDKFEIKDQRVKVIHKGNEGLSSARNAGINIAKGDYFVFIDSDDYIDSTMIEKLYCNLKENNADMSICNLYYEYPDRLESKNFLKHNFVVEDNSKFDYLYEVDYRIATIIAPNKLYKKELFKELRYPVGKIHEDEIIIFDLLKKAKRISYLDEKLYYYVQRNNSITHKFNLSRLDMIYVRENRIEKMKQENLGQVILKKEYLLYLYLLLETILPGLKSINEKEEYQKVCQKTRNLAKEIKKEFELTRKEKIKMNIIIFSPSIFIKVFINRRKK